MRCVVRPIGIVCCLLVVGVFSPSRAAAPLTAAEVRALKPGDSFRECEECPEMVVVPAGSFMMGSPPSEAGNAWQEHEFPQHRVTIARPFAVGKYEVTFAEWDACVAAGGCSYRPGDEGWGRGRRPVINVPWSLITREYLPWLSRKTGKTYRLLTEAEWEYAARAGSTTHFHFGNTETELCTYDNIGDLTAEHLIKGWKVTNCSDGYLYTAPVGSFRPNAFGLYDMHGNVLEWVQDCLNESYAGAPSDGSAWTTGDCAFRVLRGGSWGSPASLARSAVRDRWCAGCLSKNDGFRVARTL